MIIGLCGTSLPGRADVAMALISKGFSYFSISTQIDDELTRLKLLHTAENVVKIDLERSKKYGKDVWVRLILAAVKDRNAVIDGVRHPEEVDFLRTKSNFYLLGIYSPTEIRFERALAHFVAETRQDARDEPVRETLEEFNILKYIDESIPYPLKSVEAKIEEILKKTKK